MATTKSTKVAAKTSRYNELKKMLEERRRELLSAVQGKIRDVRADGGKERDVLDQGESSEVDIQEDIEFALIQMKSETLNKINEALRRLDDGTYGNCFECGEEIAHPRLRRCRSRFAARIAKRRARTPSCASVRLRARADRRRSSSTCRTNRVLDRIRAASAARIRVGPVPSRPGSLRAPRDVVHQER